MDLLEWGTARGTGWYLPGQPLPAPSGTSPKPSFTGEGGFHDRYYTCQEKGTQQLCNFGDSCPMMCSQLGVFQPQQT